MTKLKQLALHGGTLFAPNNEAWRTREKGNLKKDSQVSLHMCFCFGDVQSLVDLGYMTTDAFGWHKFLILYGEEGMEGARSLTVGYDGGNKVEMHELG